MVHHLATAPSTLTFSRLKMTKIKIFSHILNMCNNIEINFSCSYLKTKSCASISFPFPDPFKIPPLPITAQVIHPDLCLVSVKRHPLLDLLYNETKSSTSVKKEQRLANKVQVLESNVVRSGVHIYYIRSYQAFTILS